MKAREIAALAAILVLSGTLIGLSLVTRDLLNRNEAQASFCESVRLKSSATAATHWRFKGINGQGMRDAVFLFPSSEIALRTIRRIENGAEGLELGYYGKTWPFCLYPPESWQYLEAGRLLADEAIAFALSDKHRAEFVKEHLGPRYNPEKAWAKNFLTIYRQERNKVTPKEAKR